MNRKRWWMALMACAAIASGCSKDKEVAAFVAEFDTFSATIVKRVKTAPNVSAGVDAAQKYLDENKGPVREKLAAVKEVKNFQISEETKKSVEACFTRNAQLVAGLPLEYVGPMALDPKLQAKMQKLVEDYRDVIAK